MANCQLRIGISAGINQSFVGKLDASYSFDNGGMLGVSQLANVSIKAPAEFQIRGGYNIGRLTIYSGAAYSLISNKGEIKNMSPTQKNKVYPLGGAQIYFTLPRNGELYIDAGYSKRLFVTVGIRGIL